MNASTIFLASALVAAPLAAASAQDAYPPALGPGIGGTPVPLSAEYYGVQAYRDSSVPYAGDFSGRGYSFLPPDRPAAGAPPGGWPATPFDYAALSSDRYADGPLER